MKLESQVCSLELAKRLKEFGVKQESLFDWVGNSVFPTGRIDFHLEYGDHNYDIYYAAFTVAELGEMLPRMICDKDQPLSEIKGKCYPLIESFLYDDYGDKTRINGFRLEYEGTKVCVQSDTGYNSAGIYYKGSEADARAKMLIYLLENKLTPASQDNE